MAGIETLMVTDMVTASAGESVAAVAERMTKNGVGAVLLVEGDTLRGLFSERDLLTRVVATGRNPQTTLVAEVATRELVTIDVKQPFRQVLDIFRHKKFRHLPVLRDGKVAGILSTRDFLDFLIVGFERYIDERKYKEDLAEGMDPYDHLGGSYGR